MKCELFIFIDKVTNSIEEADTGESHDTDVIEIINSEINSIHKKDGWLFNWKQEFRQKGRKVYKLVLKDKYEIQGLISMELVPDQMYIELHLIENAPHNLGKRKKFIGVAANLIAFCCKLSFDLGFNGFVAFTAKTELMKHYTETLGARHIFGHNRMAIDTLSAKKLVNSYYKNYFNEE